MFKDVAGGLSTADLWHCFREPVLLRLPGDSALELNKNRLFHNRSFCGIEIQTLLIGSFGSPLLATERFLVRIPLGIWLLFLHFLSLQ